MTRAVGTGIGFRSQRADYGWIGRDETGGDMAQAKANSGEDSNPKRLHLYTHEEKMQSIIRAALTLKETMKAKAGYVVP